MLIYETCYKSRRVSTRDFTVYRKLFYRKTMLKEECLYFELYKIFCNADLLENFLSMFLQIPQIMPQISAQALSSSKQHHPCGIHQQLYNFRMKAQKTEFCIIWIIFALNIKSMMKAQHTVIQSD